jgi:hypothetical protein
MDVIIEEVVSTIRTVDGEAVLHPSVLARVIQAVVAAVEEKHTRNRRRQDDARIGEDDDRSPRDAGT